MANWCNVRLIAIGERAVVSKLSQHARTRRSALFRPDMLAGESQELFAERMERLTPNLHEKEYVFQVRNDDGGAHFKKLSLKYEQLRFVLVYDDGGDGEFGSYMIYRGRSRSYVVPQQRIDTLMSKRGLDFDADWEADDDENWWRYWEACWEIMDDAEDWWCAQSSRAEPLGGLRSRIDERVNPLLRQGDERCLPS